MRRKRQTFLERKERSVIVCGTPTFIAVRYKCSIFVSNLRRIENKHGGGAVYPKTNYKYLRFFVKREKRGVLRCRAVTKSRVFSGMYFPVLRGSIGKNNNSSTRVAMSFPSSSTFPWESDIVACGTTHFYLCAMYTAKWHSDTSTRDTLMVHAVAVRAVDGIEELKKVSFDTTDYPYKRT